jgi:hypothetical protein
LHISNYAGLNANSNAKKIGFNYRVPPIDSHIYLIDEISMVPPGYTPGQGRTPYLLAGTDHFMASEVEVLYLN